MFAYPEKPKDENRGIVPAFAPRACILGHVAGAAKTTSKGRRIFRIQSAAWVRDQLQAASFMVFFENTARWEKASTPPSGTGPLVGRHEDNHLTMLSIEYITINAGSHPDSLGANTPMSSLTI
ncbi:hypothetical protein M422DRAFT_253547 [Sphaerobolus stellatus SS14]|uniref:Unplaced genomic scaffold SPHSTscaffold_49, whole genome shotgun sequence n=1 Tax=Sphaerobolus stellatus (strain SS14) TaxID=990650 RepID=A0A0C9VN34_SPHS4|nr:hypothetical protein M422DRAFT_253547 [Sphaerobolus stellatus SS14]